MLQLIQTIASLFTLLIFLVSAFVALRQLRANAHANQLAALQAASSHFNGTDFQRWFAFTLNDLPKKMQDPVFRDGLRADPIDRDAHPEIRLANWYEDIGIQAKFGVVDEEPLIEYLRDGTHRAWDALLPTITLYREIWGDWNFRNFERFAQRSRAFYEKLEADSRA
ncbi:MAG TPA: hypothetical protein VFF60_05635 [Candidatus Binatus sp.]|nr:hypothetical protein [Candidatus Binatus sp.]